MRRPLKPQPSSGDPTAIQLTDDTRIISIVLVLGLLSTFAPISIDMYLPSLPAIGREFFASAGEVQLTLSAFFIGFALGQLFWGPLSDKFGRRPMLIAGVILYIVTSALCAMSVNLEMLIGFRTLQAFGGGAGTVITRAIVRDRFSPDHSARVMSYMMLITALAPLCAPLIGGYILQCFGWRIIFWILSVFGFVCLIILLFGLPESNPRERQSKATLLRVFAGYGDIFKDFRVVACLLTGGFAFAGMFAYISGTPFVYIDIFGVAPEAYGYLFGLNIVSLIISAYINGKFVTRFGAKRHVVFGSAMAACSGLALLYTACTETGDLIGIAIPLFFYMGSISFITSNSIALAIEGYPLKAGTVAAVFGASQFGIGAITGTAVGQFYDNTPIPMAAIIAACGVISLISSQLLVWSKPTVQTSKI